MSQIMAEQADNDDIMNIEDCKLMSRVIATSISADRIKGKYDLEISSSDIGYLLLCNPNLTTRRCHLIKIKTAMAVNGLEKTHGETIIHDVKNFNVETEKISFDKILITRILFIDLAAVVLILKDKLI